MMLFYYAAVFLLAATSVDAADTRKSASKSAKPTTKLPKIRCFSSTTPLTPFCFSLADIQSTKSQIFGKRPTADSKCPPANNVKFQGDCCDEENINFSQSNPDGSFTITRDSFNQAGCKPA